MTGLTSSLPGHPVLVLLPPGADVSRILATQRAGAAQVVPLPWQSEDFLHALDCMAVQFARVDRDARVVAVCGVTGGAGATTVSLNLAHELTQAPVRSPGHSVLLIELSRQMGSLAAYLNIEPHWTVHDILGDPARLTPAGVRQAITTVAPGLNVLVSSYLTMPTEPYSPRHVYQLIELSRRLASLVVLDVPCAFDDLQFETMAMADQVLLVGVQTVSSIRTLKMVRETLEREEGISSCRLVINRYEESLPGFSAARLGDLLGGQHLHTIANDYPSVMSAMNSSQPLQKAAPYSRVLADIRSLARAVSGVTIQPVSDSVDRLSRALTRGAPGPSPPRALRVLHIEDDPLQQQALALHLASLRTFRCTISQAPSEEKAIALFQSQPFDVVLLDYQLESGNGLGCLRRLRAINPIVPIVVVSGVARPEVAADLLEAGADDFLGKQNLSGERLARTITEAVARADACTPRRGIDGEKIDQVFDRVRQATPGGDDSELLRSLRELHAASAGQFTAGMIQRLVDEVCTELGKEQNGARLPRRALLTLFLRLFGTGQTPL
ncbi:MAG: response regulator [Gemmataceae bacterium]